MLSTSESASAGGRVVYQLIEEGHDDDLRPDEDEAEHSVEAETESETRHIQKPRHVHSSPHSDSFTSRVLPFLLTLVVGVLLGSFVTEPGRFLSVNSINAAAAANARLTSTAGAFNTTTTSTTCGASTAVLNPATGVTRTVERHLATFTVPTILEHRYPPSRVVNGTLPVPVSPTAAPFHNPAEPQRFPNIRGAVATLWGPGQRPDFHSYMANNDKNFFGPQKNDCDWFIFYVVFPVDLHDEVHAAMLQEKFTDAGNDVQQRWPNYTLDTTGVTRWRTPHGATIYTWPIVINMPDFFVWEAGLTMRDDWFFCGGKKWGFNYVHYTHAPTYQLLVHPVLQQGYDFILKFDFDVEFYEPVPTNLFRAMAENDCALMHSQLFVSWPECQRNSSKVFNRYAEGQNIIPRSANHSWWGDDAYHLYGNFVAVSTGWAQSPEMQHLAKWLYDDRVTSGYYRHRWGDQGSMLRMYGTIFDVSTEELHSRSNFPGKLCNFDSWRNKYFRHS